MGEADGRESSSSVVTYACNMLDRSVAMVDGMIEELEAFLGVSSKKNVAMKDEKKKAEKV